MKKVLYIILALLATSVNAQDRSHFYTNLLNPFLVNPAHAGNGKGIQAVLNARTMLGGIEGSPRTINFGIYGSTNNDAGLGLKVISDWRGVFQLSNFEAAYSKRVQLNKVQVLNFGLSLGVCQTAIRQELLNSNVTLEDPMLTDKNLNKLRVTSGAGFTYKYAEKFEFSTSFPMLITGDEDINGFFVSSAHYNFKTGEKYTIQPQVNYYNFIYSDKMFDLIANASWNQTLSLSAGYRSNSSVIAGVGLNFSGFSAKYMYYMHTGNLNGLAPAQNEIGITFRFNKPKSKAPAQVNGTDEFSLELKKLNKRINGLMQVESTNPGLVDISKELAKISTDLAALTKKYTVETPEQMKELKAVQESLELMIAKSSK